MSTNSWPTSLRSVTSLHLDQKNPRLGRENAGKAPRELIQFLFDNDKAIDVARSIVHHGYFASEPLLAYKDGSKTIVVEGNRRLSALKALREPGLLEGTPYRQVDRLRRQISDISTLSKVPVTMAPSRRATDNLLAARHAGTPVLGWTKENRSSFILDKLQEGYTNDQLRDRLGFTASDIQKARQFRAIADMARSVDMPEEVRAKILDPRAKLFTTVERVFNSPAGRDALCIKPDEEHGVRIHTSKARFEKAYARLISDLVLKKQTSRTLNKEDQIKKYFAGWTADERPKKATKSIVPSEIVSSKTVASAPPAKAPPAPPKRAKPVNKKVIPRSFKVRYGSERIQDLRKDLGKINRDDMPNAGAILLRVFLELSMVHYLKRKGLFDPLVRRLKSAKKLRHDIPNMRQLAAEFKAIAKEELTGTEYHGVSKALTYDKTAPFNVSELNSFVHGVDIPTGRDIEQFWSRMEPLFQLMLEED